MNLESHFTRPSFTVKEIVVCPTEDKRGRLVGYNFVAQGRIGEQSIIGFQGKETTNKKLVGGYADLLRIEFGLSL